MKRASTTKNDTFEKYTFQYFWGVVQLAGGLYPWSMAVILYLPIRFPMFK